MKNALIVEIVKAAVGELLHFLAARRDRRRLKLEQRQVEQGERPTPATS